MQKSAEIFCNQLYTVCNIIYEKSNESNELDDLLKKIKLAKGNDPQTLADSLYNDIILFGASQYDNIVEKKYDVVLTYQPGESFKEVSKYINAAHANCDEEEQNLLWRAIRKLIQKAHNYAEKK